MQFKINFIFQTAENFLETSLTMSLTAPTVPKFDCSAKLKKELSDVENVFGVEFHVHENDTYNMVGSVVDYTYNSNIY